jgi:MFS family permease
MSLRGRPDWHLLLALYWITSFVEGFGVAQVYAFLPNRLAEVGMSTPDIERFVGLLGSLFFLSGLPFIPLWGVWADKYSRKAVIIRSALVEAVVFGVVAASQAPWQLVVGMLLVAFQLGNSGVMIAAIRDITPQRRLGLAMGIFAASSPLGFGAGPALGAVMIDQVHMTSGNVFAVSAILSLAVAAMLAVGSREVRPEVVPTGSTLRLAFGAVRGVLSDRTVRWLFVTFGIVFVGSEMAYSYMSLLIHDIEHTSLQVAGSVGLVLGMATVVGALLSPLGGWVADKVGFRRVLVVSVAGLTVAIAALPLTPTVAATAVAYSLAIAFQASIGAMVSGLLAMEVPVERRSATLNLVYLPLYFGGIAGPALGAAVVTSGLRTVFYVAALVLAGGVVVAALFARRKADPLTGAPGATADERLAA